jgi:hypothetical protein
MNRHRKQIEYHGVLCDDREDHIIFNDIDGLVMLHVDKVEELIKMMLFCNPYAKYLMCRHIAKIGYLPYMREKMKYISEILAEMERKGQDLEITKSIQANWKLDEEIYIANEELAKKRYQK